MSWPRAPLVPPALAFAAGIALAPVLAPQTAWPLLIGALAWGTSLVILERAAPATAFLLAGIVATGALRAAPLPPAPDDVVHLVLPRGAHVEGRLAAQPVRFAPDRARLLLEVERVDAETRSGRVPLTAYGAGLPDLTGGQRVAVRARLHRAVGFRNPGGFDYGAWLARDGILVTGSMRAEEVIPLDAPAPSWPARVRRAARETMMGSLPPVSAALLGGLLFGDRVDLPGEIDVAFRRAGVYHVLAVSGFNVALVAGSVFALLTLTRAGRRGATFGAIGAVLAFAAVVGGEPSVLRALVMGLAILGALLVDREASVVNGLALAALLILAVRPSDLADPGFQLSFAATAGIVLAPLPRHPLLAALGVSLAAQLAVLPIALVHFNQLTVVGPLANLAAVPLAGAATLVGLAAIALSAASGGAADVLLHAVWPLLLALRGVVALAAAVPGALLHLPAPHWTAVTAYAAAAGLGLGAWHTRTTAPDRARWCGLAAGLLLAVAVGVALWPLARPPDGRLRLTVLDVGQGDAIVVEAPDGRTLLVDAGPGGPMRLDAGERVVAPFLWNRGILRLAAVITTHADADHAGGMPAIRRLFAVTRDWGPASIPRERQWIGGLVLWPLGDHVPAATRNDGAVVLRLDYGLASFILASDASGEAERHLIATRAPLAATVLKVGHHGARDASTPAFLAAVRPALAAVSVGPRNAYGHPAPETLARLTAAGARILRTDHDGALLFDTDGRA
ncbi:MAG TPA: DNA internalization-related competence protein ComEC/Rec2, partial [Methylomirabilota bacterium]|nr:DNA internalization-related competence protein ComEC/Rec2 [Methylomirabilota bacterium]